MYMQPYKQESATSSGLKWFGKVLAVGIILIVAAYGDVMYIQLMQSKFPTNGVLLVLSYLGGFTSFFTMIYMLIGKQILFAPGKQTILAWLFFIVELIMIAMNIILVYLGVQTDTGTFIIWYIIAICTPVVNLFIVSILHFSDEDLQEKHEDMELGRNERRASRNFEHAMRLATLEVKYQHLGQLKKYLADVANTGLSQQVVQDAARNVDAQVLSEISGRGQTLPQRSATHSTVKDEPEYTREQSPFFDQEHQSTNPG